MNLNDRGLASVSEKAARAASHPRVYLRDAGLGAWLSRMVKDAANHVLPGIGTNARELRVS